jgi:hypothetical protein
MNPSNPKFLTSGLVKLGSNAAYAIPTAWADPSSQFSSRTFGLGQVLEVESLKVTREVMA